jgi:hypothetical protein
VSGVAGINRTWAASFSLGCGGSLYHFIHFVANRTNRDRLSHSHFTAKRPFDVRAALFKFRLYQFTSRETCTTSSVSKQEGMQYQQLTSKIGVSQERIITYKTPQRCTFLGRLLGRPLQPGDRFMMWGPNMHRPPFQNHPLTHFSQEQRVLVRKIEPAPATLLVSVSPQKKPQMKPRRLL